MKRVYEFLLRLYPRDYRAKFAVEMSSTFDEALRDPRHQGRGVYLRFALGEMASLVMGAGIEWTAKLTTDSSVRGRTLPDRLLMRPPGVSWETHYAGAFVPAEVPAEVNETQERTDLLVQRMVHAISRHDFEGARRISNQERQARENLLALRETHGLNH